MKYKRSVYIVAFTVLGILLSFLVHAILEMAVISILVRDFNKYGLGLTWDQWMLIHKVFAIVLTVLGSYFGYWQGKHWWKVIYIDKKFFKKCK